MVDFRITQTYPMHANPLNPPYLGDFGNLEWVGVIGRCLLISLVRHSFLPRQDRGCAALCFLSVLWGKLLSGIRSHSEVSGFGDPSYRRIRCCYNWNLSLLTSRLNGATLYRKIREKSRSKSKRMGRTFG